MENEERFSLGPLSRVAPIKMIFLLSTATVEVAEQLTAESVDRREIEELSEIAKNLAVQWTRVADLAQTKLNPPSDMPELDEGQA